MKVHIIYLNEEDRKLSCMAEDIASNVKNRLQPLLKEIQKEKAAIFIYFGNGNSKIKINASFKLEQAISMLI